MRSLITTVGVEIEFANVRKALARGVAKSVRWSLVEDGSTRSYRFVLGGLTIDVPTAYCSGCSREVPISDQDSMVRCEECGGNLTPHIPWERAMYGGEFVSPLLDTDTDLWIEDVAKLLDFLEQHGEGVDAKTSIHVHVNIGGFPLFAMHQLLNVGAYLEAAMYRLACAEAGVHRGNLAYDYGYCRPITDIGPPVTPTASDRCRQVFSVDTLLQARDWTEFRQALGRYDSWGGGKYHEARYVWLNPVSFFVRGSIEFRIFNSTLQPRYVQAWVEVCKRITRLSFGKDTNTLPQHPLGSNELQFPDVIEFLGITQNHIIYTLEDLWNAAPYQRPPVGLQWGHTGHRVDWREVPNRLRPPLLRSGNVQSFGDLPQQTTLLRGAVLPSALNSPVDIGRRLSLDDVRVRRGPELHPGRFREGAAFYRNTNSIDLPEPLEGE